MSVLLFRRGLGLRSGAARLMLMQAAGLEAAGARVRIAGQRARFRFLLGSRRYPLRMSPADANAVALEGNSLVVDHQMAVPNAPLIFVHNLASELARYLEAGESHLQAIEQEREFFSELAGNSLVVANSNLVRDGLIEQFELPSDRVVVHRPGYDDARFAIVQRPHLREAGRRALRLDATVPLIGLVTSGHFSKRGLDAFLASAKAIYRSRPDVRFLVVGSSSPPAQLTGSPLSKTGVLLYRPKHARPERMFAALDLMLYPAVYEEFGIVLLESLALGTPVVTSARVGASEILPDAYGPWILDQPDATGMAERCLQLLDDSHARAELVAAGVEAVRGFSADAYAAATAATILDQNRRLR